jgi:RHS repeat-associated protein
LSALAYWSDQQLTPRKHWRKSLAVRRRASRRAHYNYYRDFDSAIGRYVESDPIGLKGGVNTYAYVGSNPTGSVDSRGLQSDSWSCRCRVSNDGGVDVGPLGKRCSYACYCSCTGDLSNLFPFDGLRRKLAFTSLTLLTREAPMGGGRGGWSTMPNDVGSKLCHGQTANYNYSNGGPEPIFEDFNVSSGSTRNDRSPINSLADVVAAINARLRHR